MMTRLPVRVAVAACAGMAENPVEPSISLTPASRRPTTGPDPHEHGSPAISETRPQTLLPGCARPWPDRADYARQRGLRRLMIPVPLLTPRLSSLWLGLVTPLYARVGRKLVD